MRKCHSKEVISLAWYEHVLGVLAILDCLFLVCMAAVIRLSGNISTSERRRDRRYELRGQVRGTKEDSQV